MSGLDDMDTLLSAGLVLAAGVTLMRTISKRRRSDESESDETSYRKRKPLDEPHDRNKNFWLTQWGRMLTDYFV